MASENSEWVEPCNFLINSIIYGIMAKLDKAGTSAGKSCMGIWDDNKLHAHRFGFYGLVGAADGNDYGIACDISSRHIDDSMDLDYVLMIANNRLKKTLSGEIPARFKSIEEVREAQEQFN